MKLIDTDPVNVAGELSFRHISGTLTRARAN
jgi:hypothetical protein